MHNGERPMGATNDKQTNNMASCQTPPPPALMDLGIESHTLRGGGVKGVGGYSPTAQYGGIPRALTRAAGDPTHKARHLLKPDPPHFVGPVSQQVPRVPLPEPPHHPITRPGHGLVATVTYTAGGGGGGPQKTSLCTPPPPLRKHRLV